MVYLNIKYVIATRNYEFFNTGTGNEVLRCSIETSVAYVLDK